MANVAGIAQAVIALVGTAAASLSSAAAATLHAVALARGGRLAAFSVAAQLCLGVS